MLRGIYAAASGLLAQQHALDLAAANISNLNTDGYKSGRTFYEAYRSVPLVNTQTGEPAGVLTDQVRTPETIYDLTDGALRETGKLTDFALQGDGFFRVRLGDEIRYRRAGSFAPDADGFLVDAGGAYLLDTAGNPIRWNPDAPVRFDERGSGGGIQIAVVSFPPGGAVPTADGYWVPAEGAEEMPSSARMLQGYLESSNVDLADELIRIMMAQRQFQASQRALQTHADMTDRAVRELGW